MSTIRYVMKDYQGNIIHVQTVGEQVIVDTNSDLQTALTNIRASIAGKNETYVVADMTARAALTNLKVGDRAWVIDASADSTVASGAAYYLVQSITTGENPTPTWVKVAEAESMDVTVSWADIANKPSSTVAEIDAAVTYHKALTATASEVNAAITYHKALTATAAELVFRVSISGVIS